MLKYEFDWWYCQVYLLLFYYGDNFEIWHNFTVYRDNHDSLVPFDEIYNNNMYIYLQNT